MTYSDKILFCTMALLLTGCASQSPRQIYQWDNYQNTLYDYYKNDSSPLDQITALHRVIDKAHTSNKKIPPGLHAHLGLLYNNTGKKELAITEFNAEKKQYPESSAYIDLLTSKNKGSQK